ncbi:CYTH and CHAD domain-containing protein [Cupriavidus sp. AU9028]|uniref:CYTH and CHAD domain-containing protein n=1 Tax=Cupriavidus sp. AU9028 TaxID=2871157 RepID=UPI001C939A33|nr:CYTH and CHAD domain-containing protein [Cupriavidus sp. AU9028]MBY4896510.1 CHAD domain-containing protein [Cupriavidus sp. AU9028]
MERELKFELTQDQQAALRELPLLQELQVQPPHEEQLESQYFDTADLQLRRHGASLRVRSNGDRHVQTVKCAGSPEGGWFEREEYETEVAGAQPDLGALLAVVPTTSPLAAILREPTLQAGLAPIFRTTVTRLVWQLKAPEGEEVELALDSGSVSTEEQDQPFTELELELKRGERTSLAALALHLAERLPLRLSLQSKSDRGYRLLVSEPPTVVTATPIVLKKKDSVDDAFFKIVQNCLTQVHANAPGVAAGYSAEAVHQMRVGLRRLRSALDLFAGVITPPEALQRELKWIADELGKSRDWEVLARATLPQVTAPQSQQEEMRRAETAVTEIARARREDAAEAVRSPRYARLALELDHWLATAPWRADSDPMVRKQLKQRVGDLAGDVLRQRHRKLLRRGKALHKLAPADRHRARIAAKKLRYTTEFFASLYQRKALQHYRRALTRLQDDLGWGNDIAVADQLLDHLQRRHRQAANGASYARGFLAARLADDRGRQRKLWKAFRKTARPD